MTRNGQVELSDLDGEHDLGLLELVGAKSLPELPLSAEQLTAVRRDLALEVVAEASPMQEGGLDVSGMLTSARWLARAAEVLMSMLR